MPLWFTIPVVIVVVLLFMALLAYGFRGLF